MVERATPAPGVRPLRRMAAGAGAFVLGDLILGSAAFSAITLASLWYFSWRWIQIRGEYLAHGLGFGTIWQLGLAWFAVFAALPLLAATVYLAARALRLPHRAYRWIRGTVRSEPTDGRSAKDSPNRGLPGKPHLSYVASFWIGP